jgi:hypothetical protein
MKSLAQIEPRTPISSLPFTITNSGSYYLTTNLVGTSGQNGIVVQAGAVTLDLQGFALSGVPGSLQGVSAGVTIQNFALYNGTISGWGGNGVGVAIATGCDFQRLRISNNGGAGLACGAGCSIGSCVVIANGSSGISAGDASTISGCVVRTNLGDGILVTTTCLVENNSSEGNGNGPSTAGIHASGTANRIEGNLATYNNGNGFAADGIRNLIVKNSARGNSGLDYSIATNNNYGQIYFDPGDGFTNSNPWANFSSSCPPNMTECSGFCASLATDTNNCGSCGNSCAGRPNVTSTACTSGNCQVMTCVTGFADCDFNFANGCEVNLKTDPHNCSSCGDVCPSGANSVTVCTNGVCGLNCNSGYGDCDHNPANGCEAFLSTDPSNCGACGNSCLGKPNVATATCSGGSCSITSCNSGYADCDRIASNGCEVNVNTDHNNCGSCGVICGNTANVTSTACASASCQVTSCASGFADCDRSYSNGCEVNTNTDKNNCGTCGHVCTATQNCVSGVCM